MDLSNEITAIILAGGQSSRMGTDKGLVILNGKPLVEYVIDIVKKITPNIFIVTSNPGYERLGYTCVPDIKKGMGPLAGILTGLIHSSTRKNLLLGCDTPFITKELISFLVSKLSDEAVQLTTYRQKAEPLCSVYDKSCISRFSECIEKGRLKITDAVKETDHRLVDLDNEAWMTGNEFVNINSEEELAKYSSLLRQL